MGYDGLIVTKVESEKIRRLLEKSKKFLIVKSVFKPSMEEMNFDRTMVQIEDEEIITYDMDTPILNKFLKKNNTDY